MPKRIYLSPPHMGADELELLIDAFKSNWIAPLGPHVDAFEKEMGHYLNIPYAAALSSGTAAVHLALILSGVRAGDEVLCQSFTFAGSANPIVYQQAQPIFIDSETASWNMDPNLLEAAIKERIKKGKKPKALIVVHLYGQPAQMEAVTHLCNRYEIPLIEDAAEALGSVYQGKKAGTLGRFGILSFNGNKIITTSGGGMLVAREKESIDRARFLATQARDEAPHYEHSHIGYNYRLSNLLAAVGRGQLRVLEERVRRKREIFNFYHNRLGKIEGIAFQPELPQSRSNRWLTAITIDPQKTGCTREDIRLSLEAENIESRPLWKPMHLQPVYRDTPAYVNGVSERLFEQGLCLPSGTALSDDDLDRICRIIEGRIRS